MTGVGQQDHLAHALRTPLTSIISYLDLLREGAAGPLSPEQEALAVVAARNADRLMQLLDERLGSPVSLGGPGGASPEQDGANRDATCDRRSS